MTIKNNGETKRAATLLGAVNYLKEIYKWAKTITREMKIGESFKITISVKCSDGYYDCSDSWETEFEEEAEADGQDGKEDETGERP